MDHSIYQRKQYEIIRASPMLLPTRRLGFVRDGLRSKMTAALQFSRTLEIKNRLPAIRQSVGCTRLWATDASFRRKTRSHAYKRCYGYFGTLASRRRKESSTKELGWHCFGVLGAWVQDSVHENSKTLHRSNSQNQPHCIIRILLFSFPIF